MPTLCALHALRALPLAAFHCPDLAWRASATAASNATPPSCSRSPCSLVWRAGRRSRSSCSSCRITSSRLHVQLLQALLVASSTLQKWGRRFGGARAHMQMHIHTYMQGSVPHQSRFMPTQRAAMSHIAHITQVWQQNYSAVVPSIGLHAVAAFAGALHPDCPRGRCGRRRTLFAEPRTQAILCACHDAHISGRAIAS